MMGSDAYEGWHALTATRFVKNRWMGTAVVAASRSAPRVVAGSENRAARRGYKSKLITGRPAGKSGNGVRGSRWRDA